MAKDEKNMPDGTAIQPEEKAPDNVIPMPDIAGPQVGGEVQPEKTAAPDAVRQKEQEASPKKEATEAPPRSVAKDSAKKTAPKDKAAKPPAAEKSKNRGYFQRCICSC